MNLKHLFHNNFFFLKLMDHFRQKNVDIINYKFENLNVDY